MRRRNFVTLMLLGLLALTGGWSFVYFKPGSAYQVVIGLERWRAGLSEREVRAAGFDWRYLEGGSGPPLLLLHGFGADKDNWTRVAPYLREHFRIIAPDLIGFGASQLAAGADYTIDAQARRVLAFAEAVGAERFHLGGSSMGGYIAGAMAALAPDRVRSLWLIAPGGLASAAPSEMFARIEAGSNPLIPTSHEDFEITLDFVFHERPYVPGPIRAHLARTMIRRSSLLERIFSALRYDSRPLERFVTGNPTPALVVWGEFDRVLHPSGAQVLAAIMPDAEATIMEDTGHLPMIERPRETARMYRDWFTERFFQEQ